MVFAQSLFFGLFLIKSWFLFFFWVNFKPRRQFLWITLRRWAQAKKCFSKA